MTASSSPRLILIGWEAADWRFLGPLLENGRMPNLQAWLANASHGELNPQRTPTSTSLWTTLATGQPPHRHGIVHPLKPNRGQDRLRPTTAIDRTAPAVWELLERGGATTQVTGWPGTHGERSLKGQRVSPYFAVPTAPPGEAWPTAIEGSYSSADLAAPLDDLRLSPEDIGPDLISTLIPSWQGVNQDADQRLAFLRIALAETFSLHAAATWLLENRPWNFSAIHYPLLGTLAPQFLAFAEPTSTHTDPVEQQLYGSVMEGAAQLLDMIFGRLLELAGEEAGIVLASPWGIRQTHGIFAAGGKGFQSNQAIHGGTLADLTPTILSWFGQPAPSQLSGRILLEILSAPGPLERTPPAPYRCPQTLPLSQSTLDFIYRQRMTTAGQQPPPTDSRWIQRITRENEVNRALSRLHTGQTEQALEAFDALFAETPEDNSVGLLLIDCQLAMGLTEEAREVLELIAEDDPHNPQLQATAARVTYAEGKARDALEELECALQQHPEHPELWRQKGLTLFRERRWHELGDLGEAYLEKAPDDALAWLAKALAHLQRDENEPAYEAVNETLRRNLHLPWAHIVHGAAISRLGAWEDATQSFETAIHLAPDDLDAYRHLAWLYHRLDKPDALHAIKERAQKARQRLTQRKARLEKWRDSYRRRASTSP